MKGSMNSWNVWLVVGAAAVLTGLLFFPRLLTSSPDGALITSVAQMRSDQLDLKPGAAPGDATAVFPLRYHAFVVGVNDYQNGHADNAWVNLKSARQDAEQVAEVLADDYRFSVTRLLDQSANYSGVMTALDGLSEMNAGDAVLIYFAGHGYFDEALDEGYWIPAGARKTVDQRPAREDWIWNSTLLKMLQASDARHILVVADSCFSGALVQQGEAIVPDVVGVDGYARALDRPSRMVLSSGDLEPVLDGKEGHSVFAAEFLRMLEEAQGLTAATAIGREVAQVVKQHTGQHVRMGPLMPGSSGNLVLLRKDLDELTRNALKDAAHSLTAAMPVPSLQLHDAALMHRQGAVQMAHATVGKLGLDAEGLFRGAQGGSDFSGYRDRVDQMIEKLNPP